MIKIRTSIFETNSSSTHVLITVKKDNYDKWVKNELYYHPQNISDDDCFISKDKAEDIKYYILSQYRDELKLTEEDWDTLDFMDKLLVRRYKFPIPGFYPLSYKDYNKYLASKYEEEIEETESSKMYFGGEGYIKFHRWINEG